MLADVPLLIKEENKLDIINVSNNVSVVHLDRSEMEWLFASEKFLLIGHTVQLQQVISTELIIRLG